MSAPKERTDDMATPDPFIFEAGTSFARTLRSLVASVVRIVDPDAAKDL
jgi:hypothetical protein